MKLIFDQSRPGKGSLDLPLFDGPAAPALPAHLARPEGPGLPELSEAEVVRHFTNLSRLNFGVDSHFYPLGSCTMKYNPKFSEKIAACEEFSSLHPLLAQLKTGGMFLQGVLEIIHNLQNALCEITGMDDFTCQPLAGAHGELTGILLMAAYHRQFNPGKNKNIILIPDTGHGTNPASAAVAGFTVKSIPSDKNGFMDFEAFKASLGDNTAGLMLTCPNTLGKFNPAIREITDLVHRKGGLVYYDGANLNAIIGRARPGDLGFDIVHLNLHKTFSTPHGGGGPGAGPVGVKKELIPFMPISRVRKNNAGIFYLDYDQPRSIGYIAPFYGNFLVLLRAYAYIVRLGAGGLRDVSAGAVLNANYLLSRLKDFFEPGVPYDEGCMHEFVLSASRQAQNGVSALDIAKALIDRGIHPPTVYFPQTVKEALMVEPTETESKEALDDFIRAMEEISRTAAANPDYFRNLPEKTGISRPDEVLAARSMNLSC